MNAAQPVPQTLGCPRCGAPAKPDDVRCDHCGTALALVACPTCFARIFQGARHCSHCGAEATREASSDERQARSCPRCREALSAVVVGKATLDECKRCGGVWADAQAFARILKDGEAQADVLGTAQVVPAGDASVNAQPYVPCASCGRLMNRLNFARCSGVLIDVCKGHGTWFDRDELRRIVTCVRDGGLTRARRNERDEVDEARRRLHEQEARTRAAGASVLTASANSSSALDAEFVIEAVDAVATVGSALWDWLAD